MAVSGHHRRGPGRGRRGPRRDRRRRLIVLLAAHARGLAGYWRTPGVVRTREGRDALGIPAGERVLGLLHLGSARQAQRSQERARPRTSSPGSTEGVRSPDSREERRAQATFGLGLTLAAALVLAPAAHAGRRSPSRALQTQGQHAPGDGFCARRASGCTLRAAIQESNNAADTAPDRVQRGRAIRAGAGQPGAFPRSPATARSWTAAAFSWDDAFHTPTVLPAILGRSGRLRDPNGLQVGDAGHDTERRVDLQPEVRELHRSGSPHPRRGPDTRRRRSQRPVADPERCGCEHRRPRREPRDHRPDRRAVRRDERPEPGVQQLLQHDHWLRHRRDRSLGDRSRRRRPAEPAGRRGHRDRRQLDRSARRGGHADGNAVAVSPATRCDDDRKSVSDNCVLDDEPCVVQEQGNVIAGNGAGVDQTTGDSSVWLLGGLYGTPRRRGLGPNGQFNARLGGHRHARRRGVRAGSYLGPAPIGWSWSSRAPGHRQHVLAPGGSTARFTTAAVRIGPKGDHARIGWTPRSWPPHCTSAAWPRWTTATESAARAGRARDLDRRRRRYDRLAQRDREPSGRAAPGSADPAVGGGAAGADMATTMATRAQEQPRPARDGPAVEVGGGATRVMIGGNRVSRSTPSRCRSVSSPICFPMPAPATAAASTTGSSRRRSRCRACQRRRRHRCPRRAHRRPDAARGPLTRRTRPLPRRGTTFRWTRRRPRSHRRHLGVAFRRR